MYYCKADCHPLADVGMRLFCSVSQLRPRPGYASALRRILEKISREESSKVPIVQYHLSLCNRQHGSDFIAGPFDRFGDDHPQGFGYHFLDLQGHG